MFQRRTNWSRLCSVRTDAQPYCILTLVLVGCSASAINNSMKRLKCPESPALTRLADLRVQPPDATWWGKQTIGGPKCLVTEVTRNKFAISISNLFLTNEKPEYIIRGIVFENRAK